MYTQNYYKKFHNYMKKFSPSNIKSFFVLSNIRMINPPLDEQRATAQIRNISDYQSKSKEDLIKALREQEPDTKKKLEKRLETKPKTKPKPEPEFYDVKSANIFPYQK